MIERVIKEGRRMGAEGRSRLVTIRDQKDSERIRSPLTSGKPGLMYWSSDGMNRTTRASKPIMKGAKMTKEIEISLGKAGSIKVDLDKIQAHEAVVDYVFMYGLKQMLNDVHASEKDLAAKPGMSQKKLDSLYRGEVAQTRVGGGDPVAAKMRELAREDVEKAIKKIGKKAKDFSKEALAKAIAGKLEKDNAAYRKAAEQILAIKPKTSEDDDILGLLEESEMEE